MAKGKKSSGKNYTSKGERRSSIGYRDTPEQRMMNKLRALEQGKDVVFTIPNPNKNETNKPFIRQRISGKEFLNRRMGKPQ
jgi:hypothetical protein